MGAMKRLLDRVRCKPCRSGDHEECDSFGCFCECGDPDPYDQREDEWPGDESWWIEKGEEP